MPVVLRLVPSSANDGVGVGPDDASPGAAAVSVYYEAHGYAVIAEACQTSQRSAYRLSHGIWGPIPTIADLSLGVFPPAAKFKPVTARMPPTILGRVRSMPLLGAAIGRTLSSTGTFRGWK